MFRSPPKAKLNTQTRKPRTYSISIGNKRGPNSETHRPPEIDSDDPDPDADSRHLCRLQAGRQCLDSFVGNWGSLHLYHPDCRRAIHRLSSGCCARRCCLRTRLACLRVAGTLPFSVIGILASLTAPLAEAGITIFAVSTFDTDYLLVKTDDFDKAVAVLERAGHSTAK